MNARSPWRSLLYKELSNLTLTGRVIDLGGSRASAYTRSFQGDYELVMGNLTKEEEGDVVLDLEKPLPIDASTFDSVLCINVLEHIYNYRNVIDETKRILKPGGRMICAVPFLIQVHPSPHDYWRFTGETLERLFRDAGFQDVTVAPIGTGVCSAIAQMRYNLLRFATLRACMTHTAFFFDRVIKKLKPNNHYSKEHYPLGYLITATKPHEG